MTMFTARCAAQPLFLSLSGKRPPEENAPRQFKNFGDDRPRDIWCQQNGRDHGTVYADRILGCRRMATNSVSQRRHLLPQFGYLSLNNDRGENPIGTIFHESPGRCRFTATRVRSW